MIWDSCTWCVSVIVACGYTDMIWDSCTWCVSEQLENVQLDAACTVYECLWNILSTTV